MYNIPEHVQQFIDKHRDLGHAVYFGNDYIVARDENIYSKEYERIKCPNAFQYIHFFFDLKQEQTNGNEEN